MQSVDNFPSYFFKSNFELILLYMPAPAMHLPTYCHCCWVHYTW